MVPSTPNADTPGYLARHPAELGAPGRLTCDEAVAYRLQLVHSVHGCAHHTLPQYRPSHSKRLGPYAVPGQRARRAYAMPVPHVQQTHTRPYAKPYHRLSEHRTIGSEHRTIGSEHRTIGSEHRTIGYLSRASPASSSKREKSRSNIAAHTLSQYRDPRSTICYLSTTNCISVPKIA
eukprot:3028180-Rhodomonas_salina.1